jgi:hypothetical protein
MFIKQKRLFIQLMYLVEFRFLDPYQSCTYIRVSTLSRFYDLINPSLHAIIKTAVRVGLNIVISVHHSRNRY